MVNKRARVGIVVAFIMFVIVCCVIGYLYMWSTYSPDYSAINHIKTNMRGPNIFSDLSNDIDVDGPDDIGFIVKGEYHLEIHYGKQIITVTRNCFFDEKYKAALAEIGIEIKYHVNDDGSIMYRVTYWDDVVDEYTRVS